MAVVCAGGGDYADAAFVSAVDCGGEIHRGSIAIAGRIHW
jgi:hypothetical protein